jgi:LuxR family transcriptional activator of conjugal transfer of Ti plasmids
MQLEMARLARDWGFEGALYAHIGHAIRTAEGQGPVPIRFGASSASARLWYLGDESEIIDPSGLRAWEGGMPFVWTTASSPDLDARHAEFNHRLRRRSVVAGVCVPIADYVAGPAYLSFFSAYAIAADDSEIHAQIPSLAFAAQQFHGRVKTTLLPTVRGSRSSLTTREITCLRLGALGHTVAESASLLSLAPRTVEFHLRNAVEKLGAPSKLRAILIAVRDGLIEV